MLRYCKLILIILTLGVTASAQDLHFSQFFEAPLLRNPSLAGIFTGDIRVQAVYRDQWNTITDAYKTGSLSAEYKMSVGKGSDYLTLGLQTLYDRAGTVSWISSHLLPALNYHKSLSSEVNRYLSLGFMAGLVSRRFDRSKMTTNTQYDGRGVGENFIGSQFSNIDASVGMSFNTQLNENVNNNMFVGLAYHHFTRPQNSFYRTQNVAILPKWVASAGVKLSVTPISYLTIQGDFSSQGPFNEVVAGALYGIKLGDDYENPLYTLHGGAFLRWNDALIPTIKVDYRPFSMFFSYDVNVSKLKTSSHGRGGFEAGVSYIGFLEKGGSLNSMLCPKF